jgi:hypothetical protein
MNLAENFQLKLKKRFKSLETEGEVELEEMAENFTSAIQECVIRFM